MTTKKNLFLNQEKDTLRYQLENQLKNKVATWLDMQPDIAWYPAQDRYQKGVSDCIINCGGLFIAAELKADDGTATPHQNLFIKEHITVGGVGGVCYTLKDVKDLVQEARKRKNKILSTTT